MTRVFVESQNIISPLGYTATDNFNHVLNGDTGINICSNKQFSQEEIPASVLNRDNIVEQFSTIANPHEYTHFERLAILSIHNALGSSEISPTNHRTLLILATTKGNIELLDKNTIHSFPDNRLYLDNTAQLIAQFFKLKSKPIVVSNACISGISAIILAQRLIKDNICDNVIVNGTDVLSKFVVSGFQSFKALSNKPCKPFDANRSGLTLGEGSATIILSSGKGSIEIANGAISNDANHISGPSRTGEGLLSAINRVSTNITNIDLISAHGTATLYNDDMESAAITRAGFENIPVNSLKGYFGHTLGAAGVIESLVNIEAMKRNFLIGTKGCDTPETSEKINIILSTQSKNNINSMIKLASGFGGCNAAALFIKHE